MNAFNTRIKRIIDTRHDTYKIHVPMQHNFKLRNLVNSEGLSPIYLHITSEGRRERINIDLRVPEKYWDPKRGRVKKNYKDSIDVNLILSNIESRITKIKTHYRLNEDILTLDRFMQEYKSGFIKVDFIAFIGSELPMEKKTKRIGTYRKNKSFYNKLTKWKRDLYFHEMTPKTIIQYIAWCREQGNNHVTINSDLSKWRKWLRRARSYGVSLNLQPEDFRVGSTNGNRTDLSSKEVSILLLYYKSPFIDERKRHALGIFLFICFTGLRIGDAKRLKPNMIDDANKLSIVNEKTGKPQRIPITDKAIKIFKAIDWEKNVSEQKLRDALKDACKSAGINKNVTFHIGRHTFATNYLRAGGKVERLQKLLNHKHIRETMLYVHIVEQELEKDIHLLDDLY